MQTIGRDITHSMAPGHTRVNLRADLHLRHAQRLHTGTRGLATSHHQLAHAPLHQATRNGGQGVFDHCAGFGHT